MSIISIHLLHTLKKPLFFYFTVLFSLFFVATACEKDTSVDITTYFYPKNNQTSSYIYRALGDSLPPYTLEVQSKGNTWQFKRLDFAQKTEYILTDSIVEGGIICTRYLLFSPDAVGNIATIQPVINRGANTVFPFAPKINGGVFPFDMQWKSAENPAETIRLTRNRHFNGLTDYNWLGKTVHCAEFTVKTQYRSDLQNEGTIAPESLGIERYAEGIGLVYASTTLGGNTIEYILEPK